MPASSSRYSGPTSTDDTANTFLYFAFGSNLLKERIQINSPSSKFVDIAKLDDYCLDFNYYSQRWKGAAATITAITAHDGGEAASGLGGPGHVWGVLWSLHTEHMLCLDAQEGVKVSETGEQVGVYQPLQVTVTQGSTGVRVPARTYQLIKPIEQDRRPSKVYLDVIRRGAKENNLPQEYQDFLEGIEHNGYDGDVDVSLNLTKR